MIIDLKKNEKESDFQIKLTLGAAHIYQAQFNRDLFTDLYDLAMEINSKPLQKALKNVKLNGKNVSNLNEDELVELLLQNIDIAELITEKPLTLDQCNRAVNIIWAFAKNADPALPLPDKWIEKFDLFPIRKYINQIFDLWTEVQNGTIKLKNA